jgi:holo-[acyl-carrier protein] synthase
LKLAKLFHSATYKHKTTTKDRRHSTTSSMKRIPFPLPLNIGTDIVHIPRILRLITRPNSKTGKNLYLDKFTRRILSDHEQKEFQAKFLVSTSTPSSIPDNNSTAATSLQPMFGKTIDMARWLAGRFAAKEAARKAAPGGASVVSWKDVIVTSEEGGGGRPEVVYVRDGGQTGEVGKLSISHDGEYVVATVIAGSGGV